MAAVKASDAGLVSRPKEKIKLLCSEAVLLGRDQLTNAGAIAAALDIAAGTFSAWFGDSADTHGSRPPRKHLAAMVRKYNEIGVCIEIEWFFEDLDAFTSRMVAARDNRKAAPIHDIDPSRSTDQWEVADANNISKELAALYIHPPPPSNDPNSFLLPVSLSLAHYPDEIEDLSVRIGLKTAYLVPTMKGCQPAETPDHEHLAESGGVFIVLGPKQGALLAGKPLEKTTLATMEYTSGALPSVILELRSRRLDLEVVPDDPNHDISTNRARVLQRFLQECQVADDERRVVWCHASLRRKSADEADA
ncbi:MAG TPA: hypothetical protein VGG99_17790 [Acetobacteraceae bacterium]|jgi:hypothetical protein